MMKRLALSTIWLLGFVGLACAGCERFGGSNVPSACQNASDSETHRVLFVGNSYTGTNDLPGVYHSLLKETDFYDEEEITVVGITPGGYKLHEHLADVRDDENLGRCLGGDGPHWDVVVLQEQSQIPGFNHRSSAFERSRESSVDLARLADERGADTVLYMTWGRHGGDEANPRLFPDFPTMQKRLSSGYRTFERAIESEGYDARVAPVGEAFAEVRAISERNGPSSTAPDTLFSKLYRPDGSHPTLQGTYLAALVIAHATTPLKSWDFESGPASLEAEEVEKLQRAARRTLQ